MAARALLVALCWCWASASVAQEAPYGLAWGTALERMTSAGVVAQVLDQEQGVSLVEIAALPSQPEDTDLIEALVSDGLGLQKVIWNSLDIEDDNDGAQGRARFAVLLARLSEQHGSPQPDHVVQSIGRHNYGSADEFYECLAFPGCGLWVALWRLDDGRTISLELLSMGQKGRGWLRVVHEGPRWSDIAERLEKTQ